MQIDRLTRAAFLISKITILFLPVSFMTSYFGLPLAGSAYTVKTYWAAFAIVLVASWLVLVGFGAVSGTLESWKWFPGLVRSVKLVQGWWRHLVAVLSGRRGNDGSLER